MLSALIKRSLALLFFVALGLAPLAAQQEVNAGDFSAGLKKIENLMEREKWAGAQKALKELLVKHEGRSWARGRRAEIEDIARRSAYRMAHPAPTPDSVSSGELKSFNAKTGKFKVVYRDGEIGDWVGSGGLRFHPAVFVGPYTLTIKGKAYPKSGAYCAVCIKDDDFYQILCGDSGKGTSSYYMAAIQAHRKGREPEILDKKETSPARVGKRFKVVVKVSSTSLNVSYNGRTLLRSLKPKKLFGNLAIGSEHLNDEITLEGRADIEWIKSRQDLAEQKTLLTFDKKFKPEQYLPKWLYEKGEKVAGDKMVVKMIPGEWKSSYRTAYRQLEKYYLRNEISKAEKYLPGLSASELSAIAKDWYRALFLSAREDHAGALPFVDKVLVGDPKFYEAEQFRAELLGKLRRVNEAEKGFESLITRFKADVELREEFALMYFLASDLKNANRVINQALGEGMESKRLREFSKVLNQTSRGPDWRKTYEIKTRHYVVRSNISRDICREAADVLEKGYLAYQAYLPTNAKETTRLFPVYLFAGHSSYLKYAAETMGFNATSTLGLYSGITKQLLIWNTPDRDQMMRTIRHEGLHQYFDRVMPSPPRWFNEGHAEYFEAARSATSWKLGEPREDHIKVLRQKNLKSLAAFRRQDAATFLQYAGENYAYSWLLVHFLHQGGGANKKILKRLFEGYTAAESTKKTWDAAFRGVDVKDFERRLKAHLASF